MEPDAARALARVQIAMWIDGELACPQCHRVFTSVDDYIERNPVAGAGWGGSDGPGDHVDWACWPEYQKAHPELPDVEVETP
jgi:hypothetical protein